MKLLNIFFLFIVLIGCKSKKVVVAPPFSPCPPFTETVRDSPVIKIEYIDKVVEKVVTKEIEGKTVEIHTVETIKDSQQVKIIYRTVTKEVENLSRTALANFQRDSVISLLNQQIKDNNALQSSYQRLKGKNATKIWWIGSLLLLLLLIIALWVRKQFSLKLPF